MKTKNFFFMVSLVILGGISKGNAQTNVVSPANQTTPGFKNVIIGDGTNTTANNTPASGTNAISYNVFLGPGAGANSQKTSLGDGSENVLIGRDAGAADASNGIASGSDNVYIGTWAGRFVNTLPSAGINNVSVGAASGYNILGSFNTFLGFQAGGSIHSAPKIMTGTWNTFLGGSSGFANAGGSSNTFVGQSCGRFNTSGNNNTFVGLYCGDNIVTGSGNTFLGPVNANLGTTVPETSNTAIIATCTNLWNTFQRLYIHSNGYAGFGLGNNIIPQNSLEVGTAFWPSVPNTVGLRFTSFTTASGAQSVFQPNNTHGVLSLNSSGDVIWVRDEVGTGGTVGVTNECGKKDFVTLDNGDGQLTCSQIFDNYNQFLSNPRPLRDSSVCIGTNTPLLPTFFNFTQPFLGWPLASQTPAQGRVKLDVRGLQRVNGIFTTSDENYKERISPIEGALGKVVKLDGKTYFWKVEDYPEMNFDELGHSGFIAQQVEEVLPHLVITMTETLTEEQIKDGVKPDPKKGKKSVNYIELIPYLVEAIKDQQNQIEDLKAQLVCVNEVTHCNSNEMKAAVEAANFESTRILTVSPNPTRDKANVVFNVEKGVDSATLQLFDINGNVLSSFVIKERDNNLSRTFEKNNYGTGTYIVSLIINGKSIDSKKIIFE